MATVEKELKLLLEQDSYKKILNRVNQQPDVIRQTNYYFDTCDFKLEKAGITLRIRNEEKNWLLCMKTKSNTESQFVSSTEIERSISERDFEYYKENPSEILEGITENPVNINSIINAEEISLLGSIRNERKKIKLFNEYTIELDHSLFPGGNESFEIEVEGVNTERECDYIMNELRHMGIEFNLNKKSKYKRFVEFISSN
ncbi:CYTH domain-containing protein [Paenibacillus sp. FSL H7-0940]|uniref:CYTH domain-containing protein n=1 Tax=Paenibacillus sp. FSL H7-0940 TaxID=2921443 RepID=UPI0030EED21C